LPLTYENKELDKVQDKKTQVSQVLQFAHLMEVKEDKVLAANKTIDNRSARRKRS
jgi:hypothetical protein